MKKLFLFFVAIFLIQGLSAQASTVPDTLVYLQSIVARKSEFIGKPFSVLHDSLRLQIRYFFPFPGRSYDINAETSTSMAFYLPPSSEENYRSYPRLEIYWHPVLDVSRSEALWKGTIKGAWRDSVRLRYAGEIISDILVVD